MEMKRKSVIGREIPRFLVLVVAACGISAALGSGAHHGRRAAGTSAARNATLPSIAHHSSGIDSPALAEAPCSATTRLAFAACGHDSQDGFLTQLAKCVNLTDPEEVAACAEGAHETRAEETQVCRERRESRKELCARLGPQAYDPEIDPEFFISPDEVSANPNPFFPLVPGNRWVYQAEGETITVRVTDEVFEIEGVECVQVLDTVRDSETGERIEVTLDWYAQDLDGNVWYFGELAQNFEDGRLVDLDGSWIAGEDLAHGGVLLPGQPSSGEVFRQEFALREAEDVAEVVAVDFDGGVEGFTCDGGCLLTLEYSPLEPGVFEEKIYLPGVGMIFSRDPETGESIDTLLEFSPADR